MRLNFKSAEGGYANKKRAEVSGDRLEIFYRECAESSPARAEITDPAPAIDQWMRHRELFTCDELHAKLSVESCLVRQQPRKARSWAMNPSVQTVQDEFCRSGKCEQGQLVRLKR